MDREALFTQNLAWAEKIARRVARQLPPSFDVDDLIQTAHIELWKRAEKYDKSTNVPFHAFAYQAVRGAVLMTCRRRHYVDATGVELDMDRADPRPSADVAMEERAEAQRGRRRDLYQLAKVRELIAALPPGASFEAFLLRRVYLDQCELEDLARAWGADAEQLGKRLAGGVRMLRRMARRG